MKKERKEAIKEAKDFVLTVFGNTSLDAGKSQEEKNTLFAIRQGAIEGDVEVICNTLDLVRDYIKDLKKRLK